MQWFYAKGGVQTGPLEDNAFHDLVRTGEITADTPVWREGMPTWVPYGQIGGRKASTAPRKKLSLAKDSHEPDAAEHAPASTAAAEVESRAAGAAAIGIGGHGSAQAAVTSLAPADGGAIGNLIEPLYRGRKWIRFTGVLALIAGILQALSIGGLIVAWLPIWMGVLLMGAAKQITFAYEGEDEFALLTALDKLRLYFKITGILAIIMIIGIIIIFAAVMLPMMLAFRS